MYVCVLISRPGRSSHKERVCTDAGGGGIRNHWFGSIKEAVKRLPDM